MLRFFTYLTAFVTTTPIFAHPHPEKDAPATAVEIGMLLGLSRFPSDKTTHIMVPSTPSLFAPPGNPSLYVSWFPNEQLSLGSEFSFGSLSGDSSPEITTLYLGGRGALFLRSNAVSGPYLLGNGALLDLSIDKGASDTCFSTGAGLGYQWRVGPAFVLRTEVRYRQWFHGEEFPLIADGANEFSLFIGLGTRLGGR